MRAENSILMPLVLNLEERSFEISLTLKVGV